MANKEVNIFFKVEGLDGYITNLDDLQDALQTMYDSDGPYFMEITVEMEENVFPMVASGDSVSNIRLE